MMSWLLLAALVQAPAVALPPDTTTFEATARAAWLGTLDGSVSPDSLPTIIARAAGLKFQARADRLVPDLDSALAASVMSGGALRESPWGWFALARQVQVTRGSCLPFHDASQRDWFFRCRRVLSAYRDAVKRDSAFAPVLADLDLGLPWPGEWRNPAWDLAVLTAALNTWALPVAARRTLERRRILVAMEVLPLDSLRALLSGEALDALADGQHAFITSRVLALGGRGEAALTAYRRAAGAGATDADLEAIGYDIELIGTPEEAEAWKALQPAERADWIEKFWLDRDLRDGLVPGGRIVAHAERWAVAAREYRVPSTDLQMGVWIRRRERMPCPVFEDVDDPAALVLSCGLDAPLSQAKVFDDRGLTYLRHGPPQQKANYPGMQYINKESWVYELPEGRRVIHFGRQDMFMPMVAGPMPFGDLMSACQVTPRYCVLAARQSLGRVPPEQMRLLLERGREDLGAILRTDGAMTRFDTPLPLNVGAYGLGSRASRITVAVDVPVASLRSLAGADSAVALQWQVRVRDARGGWPVVEDSVQRVTLPPPAAREDAGVYLTLVREFSVTPGNHDVRVVLADTGRRAGASFGRSGVVVLDDDRVGLSDIILLPDGAQGAVRQIEGTSVRLSPTFTPGASRFLQVGYLLHELAGQEVRVAVEVTDLEKAGSPVVSVSFVERPLTNRDFRTHRVGTEQLKSGAYDLTVTLTLPDGTTQSRVQRMLVRR
jgi:hypothetical protein